MSELTRTQRQRLSRGLVAAVIVFGVVYAAAQLVGIPPEAHDAKAYWLTDLAHPYVRSTVGGDYAYLYSPAFLQAITPLKLLPWPAFSAVWTLVLVAALAWTAGPWAAPLLLIQPVISSIVMGNIEMLLAGAVVAGFAQPAAWPVVLLSKVTPGVGLTWFLVRRRWRYLALAVGLTAVIALASFALAPSAWRDWVGVLLRNEDVQFYLWTIPGPLWLRVLLGAALVAWGARTDSRWTVPVAAGLAMPVAYGTAFAVMLVGVAGIYRHGPGEGDRRLAARLARRPGPVRKPAPERTAR